MIFRPGRRRFSWLAAAAVTATIVAPLVGATAASAQVFNILTLKADGTSGEAVFVGTSVSLGAQFSYDVGPTPYYIEIYDQTTGARLASCGYGTTCSATVSSNVATTHNYIADVASWSTSYPPPNVQSASMTVPVTWNATIVLNGGQPYANGPANLTAKTTYDVGPTPYYIEIYDQTNGARIAVCGSGTSCSGSESGYGTHTFVAYIAAWSASSPPPAIQATSNPLTVTYVYIN